MLDDLIGPLVYLRDIVELAGDYLAEYETIQVSVALSEDERREYEAERAIYRGFIMRRDGDGDRGKGRAGHRRSSTSMRSRSVRSA